MRHRPDARLRHAIEFIWTFAPARSEPTLLERTTPDGGVDIIVTRRENQFAGAVVRGPASRGVLIKIDAEIEYIGVRLRPAMTRAVLGIDAIELSDSRIGLRDIDIGMTNAFAECREASIRAALYQVQAALLRNNSIGKSSAVADIAVPFMLKAGGQCTVRQAAEELGWSERTLHRRMRTELGFPPKIFMRVIRLQRALHALTTLRSSAASAASTAGYADQAHMCREFLDLTSTTPKEWSMQANSLRGRNAKERISDASQYR